MRRASLIVLAAVPLLAGCYRVTVLTGAPPALTGAPPAVAGAPPPAVTVDRPWQHSFIDGLVPPNEVNVQQLCPNGVARVMTERSFLNDVARIVTWGIYSPMHAAITCASGPVPR